MLDQTIILLVHCIISFTLPLYADHGADLKICWMERVKLLPVVSMNVRALYIAVRILTVC
jgi:hypothetical protein